MRLLKNILSLAAICAVTLSFSTVITVDNNVGARAQYSDAQLAISASNPGDTILLKGGGATYGSINIAHKLLLIGEGYIAGANTISTSLSSINLVSTAAAGTTFQSLYFNYIYRGTGFTEDVDNVQMISCKVPSTNTVIGSNWRIISSNFGNLTVGSDYDLFCENSYINSVTTTNHILGSGIVKFDNCVLSSAASAKEVIFTNCIFETAFVPSQDFIVFSYCCFAGLTPNAADITNNQGSSSNCLFSTAPAFTTASLQYQLDTFSPCLGAGTSGTDIGLTGGNYPTTRMYGENTLPVMTSSTMKTAVIKPGEGLIFEFSAGQKANLNE